MLKMKMANDKIENVEGVNHLLVEVESEKSAKKIEKPIAIVTINDISGSMASYAEDGVGFVVQGSYISNKGFSKGLNIGNGIDLDLNLNMDNVWDNKKIEKEMPLTKLDYLKIANKKLVDELKEKDMFGIVTFGSYGEVRLELQNMNVEKKEKAKKKIDKIQTEGMTNLSEGLELAYNMITQEVMDKYEVKFLIISDGEANKGIIEKQELKRFIGIKEKEIPVTTIGVGVDYNADFLSSIAINTGSMFYHMKEVGMLRNIFETELKEMNMVNMKQARVKIKATNGVEVDITNNLNGFEVKGEGVYIGNVIEKQEIVVELQTTDCEVGEANVEVLLEYKDADGNKKEEKIKTKLSIVEDGEVDYKESDKIVLEKVKGLLDAKKKREVLTYYEKGDMNSVRGVFAQTNNYIDNLSTKYNFDLGNSDVDFDSAIQTQSFSAEDVKTVYSDTFAKTRNRKK